MPGLANVTLQRRCGLASQNVAVVIRNAAAAIRALRSAGLDAVIGLRECAWLDAKEKPYKLGHPAQDAELCMGLHLRDPRPATGWGQLTPRHATSDPVLISATRSRHDAPRVTEAGIALV
jgi:hypothetical protein